MCECACVCSRALVYVCVHILSMMYVEVRGQHVWESVLSSYYVGPGIELRLSGSPVWKCTFKSVTAVSFLLSEWY